MGSRRKGKLLKQLVVCYIGGLDLSNPGRVGVVMEFVSTTLRNAIEKDGRLKDLQTQLLISKQIVSGMNFLHSLNPYVLVKLFDLPFSQKNLCNILSNFLQNKNNSIEI